MLFASKINKFRTVALLLIFLGVGVMYFGFLWPSAMLLFFLLGLLTIGGSVAIYFWVGMLSTQAVQVECPECTRTTKILGKTDQCMYCKAWLSLDPKHAPDQKG
ncbi:DUF2614 family zinc ribbon-containing protein [Desmospora profundinema]|uniref:Zinc-ribbon containing domain-containing protein n=1 Tax=Desmospora profundinema TaxID=1571184 RepID=A0ABU1IS61_9BACL|nr:DUF2614 family zinc ribbon-containing protein [Desmospora profundinema]MDR6227621.1 hypothetical protein [Desmospora profundinema]